MYGIQQRMVRNYYLNHLVFLAGSQEKQEVALKAYVYFTPCEPLSVKREKESATVVASETKNWSLIRLGHPLRL